MRTHRKIQKFLAHDSSVKAVALDPDEYYIATGSSEGNVKVNRKFKYLSNIWFKFKFKFNIFHSQRFGI